MSSVLEHLEAIRDRHYETVRKMHDGSCTYCLEDWPCDDFQDALAAIELLKGSNPKHRMCPECGTAYIEDLLPASCLRCDTVMTAFLPVQVLPRIAPADVGVGRS